ncbi:MAG: hypothetical protein QNJ98_11895 [Planctomycetota bacterium]|nr:hypothetical protein [Planctomycetota bacterium]
MYTKRSELKAGLVVLAALVATLAFLYLAGGSEPIWGRYRYVHLRFEPGFVAPKAGDEVKMNGRVVGRVFEIREEEQTYSGDQLTPAVRARLGIADKNVTKARELYILTVLKLPADQVIPRGTRGQLDRTFTGTRELSLLPGWSTESVTDAETHQNPLPASEAPGLATITSQLSGIATKLSTLVDGGSTLIEDARGVIGVLRQKLEGLDLQTLNDDAKAGVAALRRTLETVEKRFGPIADKVESAADNIDTLTGIGVDAMGDIKEGMNEILATLKGVAKRLDAILVDAQPKVSEFLSDLRSIGKNVLSFSAEIQGIGPEVRAILADLGTDADTLMKTLKDTGYNLLDASEDLRAHPWKLLNEPSTDQIAFENLRNATLNYERAMRELNESSRRLTDLLVNPPTDEANAKAAIARALQTFEAQLGSVRATEKRFLELLNQQRRAAGGNRRNR